MNTFYRTALDSSRASYRMGLDPPRDEIAWLAHAVKYLKPGNLSHVVHLKRIFDIVSACIALLFLAPVLLAAAILIKVESRGPVFFRQERIGLNRRRRDRRSNFSAVRDNQRSGMDRRKNINAGRPFYIYKLRTMREDAEKNGPVLARTDDPRITRVGNFMRMTRIDEIPQFINVIKGDMSIIGPRPERSFFINKVKHELPEFTLRLFVKPGITGLAQVENGYTQTIDRMKDKLYFDLKYISELSLLQEIKIIFKTVYVVFTGKGAC